MNAPALEARALELIRAVFRQHPEVTQVMLFGSRAKGGAHPASDVDLAVVGDVDELSAEAIAGELDELPLPYRYDVLPLRRIKLPALREHIERVGVQVYP